MGSLSSTPQPALGERRAVQQYVTAAIYTGNALQEKKTILRATDISDPGTCPSQDEVQGRECSNEIKHLLAPREFTPSESTHPNSGEPETLIPLGRGKASSKLHLWQQDTHRTHAGSREAAALP